MLKRKPNRQDNNVSEPEKPAVFFERMEPKILLSADALSGLVTSDPFNEDAANAGLDISASVDLLKTSYQVSGSDADSSQTASGEDLSDQSSVFGLIGDSQEGDDTSLEALSSVLNDGNSGSATRQEIIFVDAATPDYQELLSGIDTDAADTDYQIFILQSDRDGVEQITGILGRFDTVDAVHLVGHGNEQGIQLGDSWLGQNNLADYAESLGAWSNTLSTEADILLYGCNLAADDSGRQFINELANITEADVAASDDLTGNKLLGGDWDLEFTVGEVETQLAFGYQLQQQWDGTLLVLESFEPAAAEMPDNSYEVKSDTSYGQTFSYDSGVGTYVVNNLEVVLYKDPAASLQTITVSLRDSYDGTVLGSNTISSTDLTTTEDWYSFDIGTAILNDNTTYVIQVESDGVEKVYLGVDDTSSYSNGDLLNDGGVAEPGKDAAFKVIHNGTGNYMDDFNTVSYNNSSGSLDWSPENWIEFGDDGNAASGEIHISGNSLVLEHWGGLGHEVYRNVDLTGAAKATLAFDYTITGDLVKGGVVEVLAWDGFGDNVIATYDLSASVGTTSASLDISAYANEFSAVTFRILAGGAGTNAIFTVDDVNIFASEGSNYAPVATNLDSTSNYNEGDPVVPIADILIKDADINDIVTATLTLADTSTGSLSANDGATYDPGTGVWTITDTVANVNLALANLVFNPNTDNDIDTKISISIDDGDEDASGPLTGVINLIVTPANDAPVANNDAFTVNEGSTTTLKPYANDTDVDDGLDLASITITGAPTNGSVVVNADGTVDYTHDGSETLADSFTYTILDNSGAVSNNGTVNITVTPVNDAPVVTDDAYTTSEDTALTAVLGVDDLLLNDSDLDGDTLSVNTTPVVDVSNGSLTLNTDGTFTYTPNANFNGSDTFTYEVSDGNGGTAQATVSITVDPVNDIPLIATNSPLSVPEENTRTITSAYLEATDPDNTPAEIVYTITNTPSSASVRLSGTTLGVGDTFTQEDINNGLVTYRDSEGPTNNSFQFTVSDGVYTSGNITFFTNTAPVNDAPVNTVPVLPLTVLEETQTPIVGISVTDVDAGAGVISTQLSVTNGVLEVTLSGSATISAGSNGSNTLTISGNVSDSNVTLSSLKYTGNNNVNGVGADTLTVVTNDLGNTGSGGALSDTDSVQIDITPINDAPVASNDAFTVSEGSTTNLNLVGNDTDVDGTVDPSSIVITGVPANGSIVINANGTVDYTHDGSETLSDSFTYTILDNSGAVSNTATVNLNVTPANDAPTTMPVTLTAISEDSGARLITQADLLANANDVDGNPLTATGLSISSGSGTLVDNFDGTWTYTQVADDDTGVSFSYTVTDGSLTAAGSASLDITPVNDAPVAVDTVINTTEDTVFNGNLPVASDVEGEAITYALGTGASNGAVAVNADGSFSYTPNTDYNGADSFTYTVSDPSGDSNTYTVTVNVAVANDAPVANDDAYSTSEDTALTAVLGVDDLLLNDSDLDGDTLSVNTTPVVDVSNGSLTLNTDGTFTYTPNANFNGSDTFTYEVSDGSGGTAQASVTITVTAVNDAPTTTPVMLPAISEDSGGLLITQADLLANANDVDGNSLTAMGLGIASGSGMLVDNGDGTWSYTPAADDDTSVSFSYTVTDGSLTAVGSASLDITPVNDAPVANSDAFTVNEGSTTTLNLAINDSDVDGTVDLTSIVITDAPTNGSIAVNDDGTVDYTHDGSAALADSFSYTILDNSGTVSNIGTINLSVMPAAVMEVIVATETKEDSGTADTSNTEDTSTNIEDTSSTGDEEKPGEAAVDEGALNATDELVFDTSTFTGGIGARNVLTIPALFEVDNEQGDRSTIIIRDNDTSTVRKLDITVIDRLREQFTGYDGPLQLVTTDSFISKLDDVREEIVLENNTFDMVVGGSMSMSAGISVGYAIWLARSGVLMSGLLSSMPAWAFIDPLPVLASMGTKDDEEDEEDESLESMVEEKEDDKQDDKQEDN